MTTHTSAARHHHAAPRPTRRTRRSPAGCSRHRCPSASSTTPASACRRSSTTTPSRRPSSCVEAYRRMVIGRRFDAAGHRADQAGPARRLPVLARPGGLPGRRRARAAPRDWPFPTYRDSVALVTRGVDPVEVLTLLRGDWHCGYDPMATRIAPQCTPLATPACTPSGWPTARRARARHGRAGVRRRRRDQRGRLPRGAQLRRRVAGAGRVPRAEQRLRDQRAAARSRPRRRRWPTRASATASRPSWSTATTPPPCSRCVTRGGRRTRRRAGARP